MIKVCPPGKHLLTPPSLFLYSPFTTHRIYKPPPATTTNAMLPAVRQFCTQFDLPDVSPLINDDLSPKARSAVAWEAMKVRLSEDAQVRFLQFVCARCDSLQCFAAFIQPGMDAAMRDNAIKVMLQLDGALGIAMVAFCRENKIKGISTLVEKHGAESIVYAIDVVFPVVGEEMLTALDTLKYEANPDRFVKEQDKLEKDFTEIFEATMRLHKESMDGFAKEERELTEALQHRRSPSPVVSNSPVGSRPASPVLAVRPHPASRQSPQAAGKAKRSRGKSPGLSKADANELRGLLRSRRDD